MWGCTLTIRTNMEAPVPGVKERQCLSSGCHNKTIVPVLEAGSTRSVCQYGQALVRVLLPACRWHHHLDVWSPVLWLEHKWGERGSVCVGGESKPVYLFLEGHHVEDPICMTSCNLNYLLKAPSPRASIYTFGRGTQFILLQAGWWGELISQFHLRQYLLLYKAVFFKNNSSKDTWFAYRIMEIWRQYCAFVSHERQVFWNDWWWIRRGNLSIPHAVLRQKYGISHQLTGNSMVLLCRSYIIKLRSSNKWGLLTALVVVHLTACLNRCFCYSSFYNSVSMSSGIICM